MIRLVCLVKMAHCWLSPSPSHFLSHINLPSLSLTQGGVVLVSHDERLIREVCKELWVCEGGKVKRIDGGFDEYRDILHEQFRKEGYL